METNTGNKNSENTSGVGTAVISIRLPVADRDGLNDLAERERNRTGYDVSMSQVAARILHAAVLRGSVDA